MAEPIDFPSNPQIGDTYTSPNGNTWTWDGKAWQAQDSTFGTGATTVSNILSVAGQQVSLNEDAVNTRTNVWYYGTSQLGWSTTYPGGWNLTSPIGPGHSGDRTLPDFVYSQYINNFTAMPNAYFDYKATQNEGDGDPLLESRDKIRIQMQMYVTGSNLSQLRLGFNLLGTNCCVYGESVNVDPAGQFAKFPIIQGVKESQGGSLPYVQFIEGNSLSGSNSEGVVCAEWTISPLQFLKYNTPSGGWKLYGDCDVEQEDELRNELANDERLKGQFNKELTSKNEQLQDLQTARIKLEDAAKGCDCDNPSGDACIKACDDLAKNADEISAKQAEIAGIQKSITGVEENEENILRQLRSIEASLPAGNLIMPCFKILDPDEEGGNTIVVGKWSLRMDYIQAASGQSIAPQLVIPNIISSENPRSDKASEEDEEAKKKAEAEAAAKAKAESESKA